MPRIKIVGGPKKKLSKLLIGGEDCLEGYTKDAFGNCVPSETDFNSEFAPFAPKMGKRTGVSFDAPGNFLNEKQVVKQPSKALAPAIPNPVSSIQMPASTGFDIWSNPTDINGQSPNAMNMPKQTIVDANGNKTTKGVIDIGNPTMYEAQQTPRAKAKATTKFKMPNLNQALNVGSVIANYVDNYKQQKQADEMQASSKLPDNFNAINKGSDRGWYDKNDGMYDPYKMGYKGRRQYGGSLPYAAEGMLVQGDVMAREAYVPDLAPITFPKQQSSAPAVKSGDYNESTSGSLKDIIAAKESGGNYKALPKNKDGTLASSAVGKYQFLWKSNKSWIKDVTGISSKDDFMNSPEAQEKAFDYWDQTVLTPNAMKIKQELGVNAPIENIKYAIHFAGPTGAYKYFATGKETNDVFGTSVAKIMNMDLSKKSTGGQNNNNMKIRIVGGPDHMANGGEPQYSGQSNYGLYIGQRDLYKTMAKNPYDQAGDSVQEQPESESNPHVLEAEGGETILRPDGTHMKINGPSHAEGGVKLNKSQAPEGSFIYSDTQKMKIKNPEILKFFNKAPKNAGITPADIAKQYDVNKYMGIFQNPNTDYLAKQTAMKMVQNYQRKLAVLGLVQEGIKGFPQGIPEAAKSVLNAASGPMQGQGAESFPQTAKYGGALNKFVYATGGPAVVKNDDPLSYDPFGIKNMLANAGNTNTKTGAPVSTAPPVVYNVPDWFKPWLKSNTTAGGIGPQGKPTVFNPKDPNKFYQDYNRWKGIAQKEGVLKPGEEFSNAKQFQEFLYDYVEKNNPKALEKMWDTWGTTNLGKSIPKEERTKKAFADKFFGARTAELLETPETVVPPTTLPPTVPPTTLPPAIVPPTTLPPIGISDTPTDPIGEIPSGWTQQDIRNYMNAGADYATIKKYHPYSTRVQPVLPEFVPVDWRGQAAALQSSTNAAANQLGTYTPGQGMASNLSALAGQQAENLGKTISGVDQYNASGASNMDLQRANMLNQFTQYNAQNIDKDAAEENVFDDRFRTAERLGRKGIVKTRNQGEDTATKISNLNQVESPYYYIDPYTQMMKFNSPNAKAKWLAENSGGYKAPAGSGAAAAKEIQEIYDGLGWMSEEKRADMAYDIWSGNTSSTRVKKRNYPANINKNYEETTETKDETDKPA